MIEPIITIVKSSDKIIEQLRTVHNSDGRTIEMKNEYIFLYNSMKRFNQLSSSYKNTSSEYFIARIVLLRPLVLDSMLFFLLAQLGKSNEWDRFHEIVNACCAEGVFRQFYTIKEICKIEELSKEESNQKLEIFHYDYNFFYESDSTFDNPKPKNFDFCINTTKIVGELKDKEGYKHILYLNNLYQVLSKYEHNTIVSLKLSLENKFDVKIYPVVENKVFEGYLDLLKIIAKCYSINNEEMTIEILDEFNYLLTNWKIQHGEE